MRERHPRAGRGGQLPVQGLCALAATAWRSQVHAMNTTRCTVCAAPVPHFLLTVGCVCPTSAPLPGKNMPASLPGVQHCVEAPPSDTFVFLQRICKRNGAASCQTRICKG